MARKKRPYVPKIKGCYECSQRRIDCDGTRPRCVKCSVRGIACSGFGLRYKFLDGFSSRRNSSSTGVRGALLADAVVEPSARTSIRARPSSYRKISDQRRGDVQSTWDEVYWNTADYGPDEGVQGGDAETTTDEDDANPSQRIGHSTEDIDRLLDEHRDGIDDTCSSLVIQAAGSLGTDWRVARPVNLHLLEPWKEFLLTHFSEAIAPEMVVIDDRYNGWRHLILPVARSDDMVMAAVLAASAFHVCARAAAAGPPVIDPERLYARAIGRLSERRDLAGRDAGARQLVILAIVVLLVSVMVNGLPDFPIVFQMLESAFDAVGGEEVLADGGEMGGFLGRQIRKMRVYAAPLVSEAAGVDAIVHHARGSFDCLYYYHSLYPNHRLTFDLIAGVRQQAFDMYLRRVLPDDSEARPAASPEDEPIQAFRRSLESFPEGALGEHILIWPTFIAALECRTREQRLFFERFLLRQYHRNRFMNIPLALKFLEEVWSQEERENWPSLIPQLRVFVM